MELGPDFRTRLAAGKAFETAPDGQGLFATVMRTHGAESGYLFAQWRLNGALNVESVDEVDELLSRMAEYAPLERWRAEEAVVVPGAANPAGRPERLDAASS